MPSPKAGDTTAAGEQRATGRSRGSGWTVLSAALITIGALLAPVAVVANWARVELSSTDAFVATFSPLASDPQVQEYVATQTAAAISTAADIPGRTAALFDGLDDVGLPPRAVKALGLLEGTAVQGAEGLIQRTTASFVSSDAFATAFTAALRGAHSQFVGALGGDTGAVLSVTRGQVGIELGPIVARVKELLVARGLAFADQIPVVDKTIVIVQSDHLASAQQLYALTIAIGSWLPWISLLLLIAGVAVARRRRRATLWATGAVGLLLLATAIALALSKVFVSTQLLDGVVPAGVSTTIVEQLTVSMRATSIVIAIVALAAFVGVWLTAPGGLALRIRSAVARIRRGRGA